PSVDGSKVSLAGMWYGYVSLPIFQFLLVRWYFRLFIWSRFLWQVSRIELSLVPTHPDRVGGLGFLSNTVYAFALLAVAHGALLAGQLANRIFFLGATLPEYKVEIAVTVGVLMCVVLGPLLVFAPQLAQAKRTGLREYGTLAERYVREFDAKWLRGGAPADEPFVGSSDIQSLADLGNSFEVVRTMRIAPVTKETVLQLVVATNVPNVAAAFRRPVAVNGVIERDLAFQVWARSALGRTSENPRLSRRNVLRPIPRNASPRGAASFSTIPVRRWFAARTPFGGSLP